MSKWIAALVLAAVVLGGAGLFLIGDSVKTTFENIGSPLDEALPPEGDSTSIDDEPIPGLPPDMPDADVSPEGGGLSYEIPDSEEPKKTEAPNAPSAPSGSHQMEMAFWQGVVSSDDPDLYRAYLEQFPDGAFAALARAKLGQLGAQEPMQPSPPPLSPSEPAGSAADETALWNETLRIATEDAYKSYLSEYPEGPHSEAARVALALVRSKIHLTGHGTAKDRDDNGFPWPPPKASARYVIHLDRIPGIVAGEATLGDISDGIVDALDSAGYFDRSYFELDAGAAIVTRLERIRADGYPEEGDARWPLSASDTREFSLGGMLKNLFFADPGYFRVIVFVISDRPFREAEQAPTAQEATEWLNKGFNTMPERAAVQRSTAKHVVTALIYEFERTADSEQARQLVPGQLPGATHLQRAGISLVNVPQ